MGAFQLDHTDGELRFHTSSAYVKGELKDEVIARVLRANLIMTDQYFPAFAAVIRADVPPVEAASQGRSSQAGSKERRPGFQLYLPSRLSLN
jgi:hypothetical protein